ncbi:MAG: S9 family peptidase [Candidatus Dormibacteraeota bacterium]|nr:S9 family peptidase [Candidatus Dormibacteraeota bacterium]
MFETPVTIAEDQVDLHHGELVEDPYRWLEATDDPRTRAWIEAQNRATLSYLEAIPSREAIRARLTDLWNYPRSDVPRQRGGRWFQSRNAGLQNQPVLYVMDRPDEAGRVLVDPNQLSAAGTVALTGAEVSRDGRLLVYATSAAGSDWLSWRVRDVDSGEDLSDRIEWSKFCTASWLRDGTGFTYSALDPPAAGDEYLAQSRTPRVQLHHVGTPQEHDQLLYSAADRPDWMPHATVTEDGRYVVIEISRGTFPESRIEVIDLEQGTVAPSLLVADFTCAATVATNIGSRFYLVTDYLAERQRLVAVELGQAERSGWQEVIPETDATLLSVDHFGGRLVCHYLRDARSQLVVHHIDGRRVGEISLPGMVTVTGLSGSRDSQVMHFSVSSFTESTSIWSHDLESGETVLVQGPQARIDPDLTLTEQVYVSSEDGTRIPVFLTHRRDLTKNGEVPVLLYGYGGFNIPLTPAFSAAERVWVERGGLLAVANLRGGGEFGRNWHDAGRLANKQNVFDDFCACARWLASSGWSRAGRIAIDGRSNGGLLVGACLTQHPELFGAAVPEVGVLDMLRFHKFTIGWAWTSDFGDPQDPIQYRWLRSYSPLHNVRFGVSYPATMVMTGDHDDRVMPGHSFKFAATLQAAQAGAEPILIRVETSAGHGMGKPTAKLIAERTDFLAFLERALGGRDGQEGASG